MKDNIERFNGFADSYDQFRPIPPTIIPEILVKYRGEHPNQVVDLGCGTGLSTFIWKPFASKIIGIDPNEDMLNKAIEKKCKSNTSEHFRFHHGISNDTKIDSGSTDVVTCASAFQWMEPTTTTQEVLRILKEGGVFALYNHDQPPSFNWKIEHDYNTLFNKIYKVLDESRQDEGRERLYTINEYLETFRKKNVRFIKEICVHHTVKMTSHDIIGFTYSQGALQDILKRNIPSINKEIDQFTENVRKKLGDKTVEVTFSYRVRLAIK